MGFFDKLGTFGEKVGEKAAKAATGIADKSKILAEKSRLKSQLNAEQANITKQYSNLGKKYFELHSENPSAEFEEIVSSIIASNKNVEKINVDLAALEVEASTVGTKQEDIVETVATEVEPTKDESNIKLDK